MKPLLLLILLPFFDSPTIGYKQLRWSDFKGAPSGNWQAVTFYSFTTYRTEEDGRVVKQRAVVNFHPTLSYTRTNSSYILRHEQLHLDIAKQYAQQLKVGMNADSLWKECFKTEELYDAETNHSLNREKQKEWEEKIKM